MRISGQKNNRYLLGFFSLLNFRTVYFTAKRRRTQRCAKNSQSSIIEKMHKKGVFLIKNTPFLTNFSCFCPYSTEYTFTTPSFSLLTIKRLFLVGLSQAGTKVTPSGASPVFNILINTGLVG